MPSTFVIWRDRFEAIFSVGAKYIVPLLSGAATALGVPPNVAAVLDIIPALMSKLEAVIPAKGSGPVKSKVVMSVVQIAMDTLEANLTGAAATSFEKLKPLIQASINNTISAVNDIAPGVIMAAPDAPATTLTPGDQAP